MKTLYHTQDKFQRYLLEGNLDDFQQMVVHTGKVPIETRLAIYQNAYQLRLIEALASHYPVLNLYLGQDRFEALASDYIAQFPSHYRSIRWFGDQIADFLDHHSEYKTSPYLSELAQFEWMHTQVFDAVDHPVLQFEEVANIHPERWATMRLSVHPSLHVIQLSWNVVPIWQAISDDQTPPGPSCSHPVTTWALWRQDFMNRFCALTESEAWAMNAIVNNVTFGEICEGLCQWVDEQEAGVYAASLLRGWIASGLLAKVY